MNITDFSLKLNGFPIKETQEFLKKIQGLSNGEFSDFISQKKQEIVAYHMQHNAFYQSLNISNTTIWNELPVITKRDLQIPLHKRLSKDYPLSKVYQNKTSGSTGDPFYFAKDKFCHALTWSIIQNRFNWHDLYGKKQARFYGIPKQLKPRLKERIKDAFSNRYRFDVFDLSEQAFENWILRFSKNNYVYLNGYTTVILAFAKYLTQKNILLKDICPSIKACVVTSEMCFKEDKLIMEKAFGVPVINEYGASELDLIAFQNKNDEWILNTESLFVEILDKENNPVPDGESGRMVITSLFNKAHPFIRYDIGDVGTIQKIDEKKSILISLEGRKEDLVRLPSGKVAPGLTFYYITKSVMEDHGQVKEIKVFQTKLNTFEIHYSSKEFLSESQTNQIKMALFKYLEPNLNIVFHKFDQLERSKSGKLKQFTSLLQ